MFSLFSSFDNAWLFFPNLSEILFSFLLLLSNYKFNFLGSILKIFKKLIMSFMQSLSINGFSKGVMYFFWLVMFMFLVINFSSVFPYNFAYSSQMSFVMYASLSVWSGLMVFNLLYNSSGFSSHMIPEGSPLPLVPALFLIEIVSSLIRPITLTVRLVANILAGHLLLILLSKVVCSVPSSIIFFFCLNLVEFFVAVIQAYIFLTMISLYYCEVN